MRVPYNGIRCTLALLTASVMAACGEEPGIGNVVVRVEVTPERDSMVVGDVSIPFTARAFNARDEAVSDALFTWRSDQPFIAAVDSLTGRIVAVQPGVAAITARSGLVSDTGEVFVIAPFALSLPVDTIMLVPGDTFTVPVSLEVSSGGPAPPVTFGGGDGTVASIDPTSGLVTAIADGVVGFTAQADSVQVRGGIQVRTITDTLNGALYLGLTGALDRQARFSSRGFNHPTDDGGTAVQVAAGRSAGLEQFAILLTAGLSGPRADLIGTLAPGDLDPGKDPVCLPPGPWAFYRDQSRSPRATALSLAGGTVSFTRVSPITGGWAVGGRFRVTLQLTDLAGPLGEVFTTGTFTIPVVELSSCPT